MAEIKSGRFGLLKAVLLTVPVFYPSGAVTQQQAKKPAELPPAPHFTFDVVSIRESREGRYSVIDNIPNSSFYQGERETPLGLILNAYDLHIVSLLENVPAWATTTKYNITAKSDDATDNALAKMSVNESYAAKRKMLQALLADRFKLRIHAETRLATTYELVATERAATLIKPVQGEVGKTISSCNPHFGSKGVDVDSNGCPFTILFSAIEQDAGTHVVDHTGFSGIYAYHLSWSPAGRTVPDEKESYPRLADALRQELGLELKKTRGPVTYWVVDHIEQPSAN